jgi:hypothetical protein
MEGDERKGAPTKRSYPNDLLPKWPWFSHEAWKTNTCAIPIFMLTRMCNCDQRHTTTGIASCCYPALIFGIICYTSSMAKPMSFHASFIRSLPIKTSKSPNKREERTHLQKHGWRVLLMQPSSLTFVWVQLPPMPHPALATAENDVKPSKNGEFISKKCESLIQY